MLSTPKAGWSELTLGDFKASVSFLTDVPFDWLRACVSALKYGIPAACFLDSEGSTTTIIVDNTHSYIVTTFGNLHVMPLYGVYPSQFARDLVEDIKRDFEDWLYWIDCSLSEEQWAHRRQMLEDLIEETEKAIEEFSHLSGINC